MEFTRAVSAEITAGVWDVILGLVLLRVTSPRLFDDRRSVDTMALTLVAAFVIGPLTRCRCGLNLPVLGICSSRIGDYGV